MLKLHITKFYCWGGLTPFASVQNKRFDTKSPFLYLLSRSSAKVAEDPDTITGVIAGTPLALFPARPTLWVDRAASQDVALLFHNLAPGRLT